MTYDWLLRCCFFNKEMEQSLIPKMDAILP